MNTESEKKIRFFRIPKRIAVGTMKLTLRETPPEAAFVGIWRDLFFVYDYNRLGGETERDRTRNNFDRFLEERCREPETLFVGELLGSTISFEGPVEDNRISCLCNLLRGVFGYEPLDVYTMAILDLNPQILVGTCQIGHLQGLVGQAI